MSRLEASTCYSFTKAILPLPTSANFTFKQDFSIVILSSPSGPNPSLSVVRHPQLPDIITLGDMMLLRTFLSPDHIMLKSLTKFTTFFFHQTELSLTKYDRVLYLSEAVYNRSVAV